MTWTLSAGKILSRCYGKLWNARGFTLLELIVVLAFIGLIAGLTTPFLMSTLDRANHQTETRKIKSALQFARSEAITSKTVFTFNGDTENRTYWITAKEANRSITNKTLAPGFTMAHITSEEETIDKGKFTINFYPRGNSSGGAIRVAKLFPDQSDTAYEITIDVITGTSKIDKKTR